MKHLLALLFLSFSLSAHAQLQPGETELTLADGSVYQGTAKDGKPDGSGYLRFKDGGQYEGGFKDGIPHGSGIFVTLLGDRYEGQFDNGAFDGSGKMVYRLGGSYAGQWKKGRPHGKGVMTYMGNGRKVEGEFVDGLPAGAKVPAGPPVTYSLRDESGRVGSHIFNRSITGSKIPLDKRFADMSDAEKDAVRSLYPALAPEDEPPFPAAGMKDLLHNIQKAQNRVMDKGTLGLIVEVQADGKPSKVFMIGENNPELKKFVGTLFMQKEYKPAMCDGKPCAMPYFFSLAFKTSL